ncbi:MFS transporter [Kocuria marina]|uniref:MFS transporter n=1 Tax=Kocuria marina TaxID=223184 RepID=UPI0011A37DE1|nr:MULTISPECIES: MFS transporter [Kocuria]MCT2020862.1 MFS transporter [Kocuria marina]
MSSTTVPGTELRSMNRRSQDREARRVILSSYLGFTIEYYDFLLYASASALVFPHVFFQDLDPVAGVIASYGTFAGGYLARPLGGAISGHVGDRLGRKKMLILSMFVMGIGSTLIGLIPSSASIGSWGAILLILLRVFQGIAVGGEWGGAALMALEHSSKGKRGFAASFTNAGAPTGAALGTTVLGLCAAMPTEQFLSWGRRIPFLASVLLLMVGIVVRSKVSESPIFKEAVAREEAQGDKPKLPILEVLRRPKALIYPVFGWLGSANTFLILVALCVGLICHAAVFGPLAALALISAVFILLTRESKDLDLSSRPGHPGFCRCALRRRRRPLEPARTHPARGGAYGAGRASSNSDNIYF